MVYDISFNEQCPRLYRLAEIEVSDDLSVVEVGYNRVPKGLRQVMKRDVYILHYITGGKGRFMGAELREGSAYIVVPGMTEILEADKEESFETYWIVFHGIGAKRVLDAASIPLYNTVFPCPSVLPFRDILHEAVFDITPKSNVEEGYLLQAALYRILALHLQNAKGSLSSASDIAKRVKSFIENHYDQEIRIDAIASLLKYSRSHLYRVFKEAYGVSIMEHLLITRIEKSKALLLHHPSISSVSYAVGFHDPLYFSRVFQRRVGMSPSQYKKILHERARKA